MGTGWVMLGGEEGLQGRVGSGEIELGGDRAGWLWEGGGVAGSGGLEPGFWQGGAELVRRGAGGVQPGWAGRV